MEIIGSEIGNCLMFDNRKQKFTTEIKDKTFIIRRYAFNPDFEEFMLKSMIEVSKEMIPELIKSMNLIINEEELKIC